MYLKIIFMRTCSPRTVPKCSMNGARKVVTKGSIQLDKATHSKISKINIDWWYLDSRTSI